jgi:uncharacterized membrane protein YidH (DUF202 family)
MDETYTRRIHGLEEASASRWSALEARLRRGTYLPVPAWAVASAFLVLIAGLVAALVLR